MLSAEEEHFKLQTGKKYKRLEIKILFDQNLITKI